MKSKHNKKSKQRRSTNVKKLYLKKNKNGVLKSKKKQKGGGSENVEKLSIELIIDDAETTLGLVVNETDNIIPTIKKYLISNNYTLFGNEDIKSIYHSSFIGEGEEFLVDPIVYFGEERIEEIFLSFSELGIEHGARLNVKRVQKWDDIIIDLKMKMDEMINYIVGIKEKQDRKLAQRTYFINLLANMKPLCTKGEESGCENYIYDKLTTTLILKGAWKQDSETKTYKLNELIKKELRLIFKYFLNNPRYFPRLDELLTKILSDPPRIPRLLR